MKAVRDRLTAVYGSYALEAATGIVHVTAVWRDAGGGHTVLRINDDTPKSATDSFVLRAARARADVIITTGRILRDEPDVTFGLDDPSLEAWRTNVLMRSDPVVAILTSGNVDFSHPAFAARKMLVYSRSALDAPAGVEVVHDPEASPVRLVEHLERRGAETILVEAGPFTARALYAAGRIDELLLSVYDAPAIPESVAGGAFLDEAALEATFEEQHETLEGSWRFSRWLARR